MRELTYIIAILVTDKHKVVSESTIVSIKTDEIKAAKTGPKTANSSDKK